MKSPTHKITVTPEGIVTLDHGDVIPDRDCVLTWDPVPGDTTPACQVFSDGRDETHFLALVSPPRQPPVHYSRDVILLVDHSGSMQGPKWEAADWAVERFITGLTGKDTFNLCLFESRTYWYSDQPQVANEGNKTQAIRFLKDKKSGGTELGVALEQAISQQRRNGIISRNIIIITDAEVSDAARIFRIVDKESQHKEARRFSILCIDASPNANLAQQLAERGGGIAKFLSSSPKEEDITSALDEILALWDAPVAVGLMLRVNRENLLVDRRKVKKSPDGMCHVDLGDLSSGKSTWVVVRAPPNNVPLRFELCGSENWTLPVTVETCPAVSVLFGARLVAELEYLMHAGYPEKELSRHLAGLGYDQESLKRRNPEKVYAENQMQDAMSLVRDVVVRESLKYQVISAETAFIAVRTEPGRTIEEQVIIPNALPSGWSESFVTSYSGMRKECVRRGSRPQPCGGGPIDWVGGGGGMDMIMQPDGTMKLDPRDSVSSPRKSSNLIVAKNVPVSSQSPLVPANSITQNGYRLFDGIPVFMNGEAILFDSSRPEQTSKVPKTVVLKKLEFVIKDKITEPHTRLYLLLYLGDTAVPRLKVLIKDMLQHNGSRPLNLQRTDGELLKIVLVDPDGEWTNQVSQVEMVIQ
jgi:Ca-activated chloride channel family protein